MSNEQHILVVDDDPKIARLVRSYLEQAGYVVDVVHDGDQALQAMRSRVPHLVVLDLMLPGRDGLSVAQAMRTDAALRSVAILMLTARVDDVDRIVGLELGADDYVTKPFNPREVVARVKAILRRTTPAADDAAPQVLAFGDIRLDPAAHRVTAAGDEVILTPSEFDILHLLMAHPGQAFSRAQWTAMSRTCGASCKSPTANRT
jgi:two-component system alkaline phosphatase synthesis response regulator PhoP